MTTDGLGTLDYLNRKRDAVGHVATEYRDELAAAINLMPQDVDRWHLESLLHFIDRAVEAEVAFHAACQAVDHQYRLDRTPANSPANLDPSFTPALATAHQL